MHLNDELIVSTRDGRVLVYKRNDAEVGKVRVCITVDCEEQVTRFLWLGGRVRAGRTNGDR